MTYESLGGRWRHSAAMRLRIDLPNGARAPRAHIVYGVLWIADQCLSCIARKMIGILHCSDQSFAL